MPQKRKGSPATATATRKQPQPRKYLEALMFRPSDVIGRKLSSDNMEDIHPRCVNRLMDGDVVAVYTFSGLKKISKSFAFEDVV